MTLKDTCDELEAQLLVYEGHPLTASTSEAAELLSRLADLHYNHLLTLVKLGSLEAKLHAVDAWKGYAREDEVEAWILRFKELKKRVEGL